MKNLRKAIIVPCSVVLLLLVFLAFGPTDNNRFCYLFQYHIWPRAVVFLPTNDPKSRTTWWTLTQQASLENWESGVPHGRSARWWASGTAMYDGVYRQGKPWAGSLPLSTPPDQSGKARHVIVEFDSGSPIHARNSDGSPYTGSTSTKPVQVSWNLDNTWKPTVETYRFVNGDIVGEVE